MPLFHCFGCVIGVLGAFSHGACLCPVESFDPRRVLEVVSRERCTALYGVPTMFSRSSKTPVPTARPELAPDRHHGRRALSRAADAQGVDRMHLPELTICYGLTRDLARADADAARREPEERRGPVGKVMPEIEVKIVDPASGDALPTGQRGELWARGYVVMKGYYNMPEQTAAAITPDGWLRSGDEASIDEAGNARITGRIKDLIIRGGENVAPKEIEDVMRQHPAVADVSVYAVTSEFFGEEVGSGDSSAAWSGAGSRRRRGVLQGAARAVQGPALREGRGRVSDDRVRQDSEVPAPRAA